MDLNQSYIDSLAPNASAASNGKALAGKFLKLNKSDDETLLFGECAGSGKNPYSCSVDFIDRENPVVRCSCPSRQIPCKHALGLLYAYAGGKPFQTEAIPEDILTKRNKIEKRLENKERKASEAKAEGKRKPENVKPFKAKMNAVVKKIDAQLEGIGIAGLLLNNILQTGLAGLDAAAVKNLERQAKELGNYYIGGIQNAFNEVLIHIKSNTEQEYDKTIESVLYMNALLKKAKDYLESKKENEDNLLKLDISSAVEEQIGHIWTLEELLENNMYIENAKLVQLAFYSYGDDSRREFVDVGFQFCLNDANIYLTYNYRPYKALKYVKEEDSRYELTETPELYIYPGDANPRVRWNKYTLSEVKEEHLLKIKAAAKTSFADTAKAVKNQIKSPLSDKNPVFLLHITDVGLVEMEDGTKQLYITDEKGVKQVLQDKGYVDTQSVPFLKRLDNKLLIGNTLLVMFVNDTESGVLAAKPLALVTDKEIVRLVY